MVSGDVAVKILSLVRAAYPDWEGIEDPRFVKDEITYKRKACSEARESLGPEEFRSLMDAKDYEEIRSRLQKLANSTNLLNLRYASTSDIKILTWDALDFSSFVPILFDLLYGDGTSMARLARYLEFVTSHDFPNHWPFPTYLLFLLHPETEFFIKPEVTKDFLKLIGEPLSYSQDPDAAWYGQILDLLNGIRDALGAGGVECRDMIDLQSLVWVAVQESRRGFWKIAPGPNAMYWDEWKSKGIVGIGWNEMGDLSDVPNKDDFTKRVREAIATRYPTDTEKGFQQLWHFLRNISPGDLVLANDGTTKVLGLGTVIGRYRYDPESSYAHVIDVSWDDLGKREVQEGGWRRGLIKLDREKFEAIQALPPIYEPTEKTDVAKIFAEYYPEEDDRRLVCELLADAVEAAHKKNPKVWGLSVRSDKIRLNVGFFAALDCKPGVFRISVLQEKVPSEFSLAWQSYENHKFHFKRIHEGTTGYDLPLEEVSQNRELVGQLLHSFVMRATDGMNRSPYARFHRPDVLQYLRTFLGRELTDPEPATSDPVPGALFSPETFALLQGLEEEPSLAFYQERKDEIQTFVEAPVKDLLHEVAKGLPAPMLELLETEKNLFSRIPKNDYGRGGAWPYYWGAFYPRWGKRIGNCQLFVTVSSSGVAAGFAFGGNASEDEKRFCDNLRAERGKLVDQVCSNWSSGPLVLGGKEEEPKAVSDLLKEWENYSGESGVGTINMFLPVEEVLAWKKDSLVEKVRQLFVDLFPLVLFATEDDPMPAVLKWLDAEDPGDEPSPVHPLEAVLEATGFDVPVLERWKRSILRKKQAVFYGPPGTGKTFIADHLARHLIGGGRGFSQVVQFHPSYAYEDFIEGIRPSVNGADSLVYTKERGVFLEFCRKAAEAEGDPCVLIVDEINRAPLSRVFGELMYLLEYRDRKIRLASGREFRIPRNVYLIGTMNTADRSIALVDHALRRRFAFIPLFPEYGVLEAFHAGNGFDATGLVDLLREVNHEIGDRNYSLGVSFFMDKELTDNIEDIWRMEIEPYLEEYFYDQNGKMEDFRWDRVRRRVLGGGE